MIPGLSRKSLWIFAAVLGLAACERELILEGERLDPRAMTGVGATQAPANRSLPIALPAMVNHAEWTHRGGSASHTITHPALGRDLTRIWSAPIGEGASRRFRLTADPVVAGGRIFTMDARATVVATGTDGTRLWSRDIRPDWAGRGIASGGGLAVGAGRLFVTSAYGKIAALDPASGAVLWRKRFEAPLTAPPTVAGDQVFVTATDGSAWALDAGDGKVLWQLDGLPAASGMVGGAAPAVSGTQVFLPFTTGDLAAAARSNGAEAWRTRIAGRRLGQANAGVSDISGDPVVVGATVYAGNRSGRLSALDAATGTQRWSAREGAFGPVWPAGDSLFLVSDQGELVRLLAATGERVWGVPLGRYLDTRERRRAEVVAHFGPVLAGGQLLVASSDGVLRGFDPASGALVSQTALPSGATTHPVVVGRTLHIVTRDGQLHALR